MSRRIINLFVFVFFMMCANAAYGFQLELAWDANSEPDIAGYKVHYGTISKNYVHRIDVGNHQSATISSLEPGKTYYFAVTAYDIHDNESDYSDEISYRASKMVINKTPAIQLLLLDD